METKSSCILLAGILQTNQKLTAALIIIVPWEVLQICIIFLYFLFPCTEAFLFLGKIWFLSYWIWGVEKNPTIAQTFLPLCGKQGNGPCHQKCRHIGHTHKDEISIGQKTVFLMRPDLCFSFRALHKYLQLWNTVKLLRMLLCLRVYTWH